MLKLLRSAVLVLGAGVSAASVLPSAANADGITLSVGDHGSRFGLYVDDYGPARWRGDDDDGPGPGWGPPPDDDGWDRGPGWRHRGPPPPPPPRRCSPDQALDKAARMGLRHPRITDVDRHTIEVSGRRYGDRYVVTFARAPFCPVVD